MKILLLNETKFLQHCQRTSWFRKLVTRYIFGLSNRTVFLRVSESVVVLMIDFFSVRWTRMKDT